MSSHWLILPDPSDDKRTAVWTGKEFIASGIPHKILSYGVTPSGWSEELTRLHESASGSDHFIDIASRLHAVSEIGRVVRRTPSTLLEVGCSSGFLLDDIRRQFPEHHLIGADYTAGTLQALATRIPDVPFLQFDLRRCPIPDNTIDVSVLLNVLEHIDDDEGALRQLVRITRPGGAAIIEVPSGSSLYCVYDRVLMHHRRYDMDNLTALLKHVGFTIERKSHLGAFLYPAFYVTKRFNQRMYRDAGLAEQQAIISKLIKRTAKSTFGMTLLMTFEEAMRRYIYFPFGIRCLVTARKAG